MRRPAARIQELRCSKNRTARPERFRDGPFYEGKSRMKTFARPVAFVLSVLIALALAACNFGPSAEEIIRDGISERMDQLSDPQSQAYQDMVNSLSGAEGIDELGLDANEVVDSLFGELTYEIGDIEVDDEAGTATAQVSVTCRSLTDVTTRFLTSALGDMGSLIGTSTQEDMLTQAGDLFMDALEQTDPQQTDLELSCTEGEENVWTLDESATNAIASALIGTQQQ